MCRLGRCCDFKTDRQMIVLDIARRCLWCGIDERIRCQGTSVESSRRLSHWQPSPKAAMGDVECGRPAAVAVRPLVVALAFRPFAVRG